MADGRAHAAVNVYVTQNNINGMNSPSNNHENVSDAGVLSHAPVTNEDVNPHVDASSSDQARGIVDIQQQHDAVVYSQVDVSLLPQATKETPGQHSSASDTHAQATVDYADLDLNTDTNPSVDDTSFQEEMADQDSSEDNGLSPYAYVSQRDVTQNATSVNHANTTDYAYAEHGDVIERAPASAPAPPFTLSCLR